MEIEIALCDAPPAGLFALHRSLWYAVGSADNPFGVLDMPKLKQASFGHL